jgi:nucleotide-binding universal stress UspA family protein
MVEVNHILCPVDFSDHSRDALDHARALARFYAARLTVLHVYGAPTPPVAVIGRPGDTPLPPPINPDEVMEQVRRFCVDTGVAGAPDLSMAVEEGRPAKEIVRFAEQHAVDLVVIGTHGRSGFERLFLGSVAEKLIRSTQTPVVTVPPPVDGPGAVHYRTLLCPTDFSDASTRALAYALKLAKEAGSRVVTLHVVEMLTTYPVATEAAAITLPDYQQSLEQDAKRRLTAAFPADARTWVTPTEIVANGRAYTEIMRIADDVAADLIVMGVHGRGAMDRWFFGSTTNHVIRQAHVPVLTLRA